VRHQGKGICERDNGVLKRNTVFAEIVSGFGAVPFKSNINTFMLVHLCIYFKGFDMMRACGLPRFARDDAISVIARLGHDDPWPPNSDPWPFLTLQSGIEIFVRANGQKH
jgi:hypothetical protein